MLRKTVYVICQYKNDVRLVNLKSGIKANSSGGFDDYDILAEYHNKEEALKYKLPEPWIKQVDKSTYNVGYSVVEEQIMINYEDENQDDQWELEVSNTLTHIPMITIEDGEYYVK